VNTSVRIPDRELDIARAIRAHRPVRNDTDPLVAVEWFDLLRDIAQVLYPIGSDGWHQFMDEAGYFAGY